MSTALTGGARARARAELQDARAWMLAHAPDTLAEVIAAVELKLTALDDTEAGHDD